MNKLKNILRRMLFYSPVKIFRFLLFETLSVLYLQPIRRSFSQKGEDLIIENLLHGFKGIYVDIGANDPHRFSNTKRFYQQGIRGINIEPNPTNFQRFIRDRANDINLNIGIGKKKSKMTFYVMFPDTLSTYSKETRDELVSQGYVNEKMLEITTYPLSIVLEKYCKDQAISFFSIDTEGYDLIVLESNNWRKYRPKIICIESSHKQENKTIVDRRNELFLKMQGYVKTAHTEVNDVYVEKSFLKTMRK